jgi:hypothetical protein
MKKLLLAFFLMAAAVLFYVDPNQKAVAESVTINETVKLESTTADMTAYGVDNSDGVFLEVSLSEALRLFDEKGNGILFLAKPDGTNCMIAAQVLYDAAKDLGVQVYYVNTRGEFSDEDYQTLTEYIKETFVTDANGTSSFAVPDVIGIQKGEITDYHVSLVDGVTVTSEGVTLTDVQREQLKEIYQNLIVSAGDEVKM